MPRKTSALPSKYQIDTTIKFYFIEYERYGALYKDFLDAYYRKFDFYLTVLSAGVAGIVAITISDKAVAQNAISVILFFILSFGLITFATLTASNINSLDAVSKMAEVRERLKAYGSNDLESYIASWGKLEIRTQLKQLLFRGIFRTHPKSIVVVLNSVIFSILLVRLLPLYTSYSSTALLVFNTMGFLLSSILHLLYGRLIYRMNSY